MSYRDDEIEELKHTLVMAQNRHRTIQAILSDEIDRLRAFVAAYDEWLNAPPTVFHPGSHSSEDEMNRAIAMREARAAIDAKAVED